MKKTIAAIAAVLALSIAFLGCSSASGGEDSGISAPSMAGAASLAASGGTQPASVADAISLYTDSYEALNALLNANKAESLRSVRGNARATTPDSEDVNVSFSTSNGGTVAYTGKLYYTKTVPDEGLTPAANTTYQNVFGFSMAGTINGTLTNAQASDGTHTYTINGFAKNIIDESVNIDITTGSDLTAFSDASYTMDFAFGLGFGTAFSVRRDDGVGAKFIISYAANYGKGGINIADPDDESEFASELGTYLQGTEATLKVYNDANVLIWETKLTGSDAFATSVFGS